jgi:rsbT co-antagonist protein RsbR
MFASLRRWLDAPTFVNPIERRQAIVVQMMLIGIFITAVLVFPICYIAGGTPTGKLLTSAADGIVLLGTPLALLVFRRGHFRRGVSIATIACLAAITLFLVPLGLRNSGWALLAFPVPITLIGLLGGRRGMWMSVGSSIASVIGIAILEQQSRPLAGFAAPGGDITPIIVAFSILMMGLVGVFLDRFGASLVAALGDALAREQDLERLRDAQEQMITERTADLQQALADVQTRAEEQARLLAQITQQEATIRDLSVPVIPINATTLIIPLVGALNHERLSLLQTQALQAAQRTAARTLILDITGVPLVDSQMAQGLLSVVQTTQLLGTETVLVGIRPEVAQALVSLGLDLAGMRTFGDLQSALGRNGDTPAARLPGQNGTGPHTIQVGQR